MYLFICHEFSVNIKGIYTLGKIACFCDIKEKSYESLILPFIIKLQPIS